ncbi:tRNase Z TRZ1-like protein [Drosera capensis]
MSRRGGISSGKSSDKLSLNSVTRGCMLSASSLSLLLVVEADVLVVTGNRVARNELASFVAFSAKYVWVVFLDVVLSFVVDPTMQKHLLSVYRQRSSPDVVLEYPLSRRFFQLRKSSQGILQYRGFQRSLPAVGVVVGAASAPCKQPDDQSPAAVVGVVLRLPEGQPGYLVYSVKQKLRQEFAGLSGNEIKELRLSGVEITNTFTSPEVAFTGDTMGDFVVDPANSDVLKARILVMECTFLDDAITVEHAREYGHTHLAEVVKYSEMFKNKAILLIHFSARYYVEEINDAVSKMPAAFTGRVFALTEGI